MSVRMRVMLDTGICSDCKTLNGSVTLSSLFGPVFGPIGDSVVTARSRSSGMRVPSWASRHQLPSTTTFKSSILLYSVPSIEQSAVCAGHYERHRPHPSDAQIQRCDHLRAPDRHNHTLTRQHGCRPRNSSSAAALGRNSVVGRGLLLWCGIMFDALWTMRDVQVSILNRHENRICHDLDGQQYHRMDNAHAVGH